MTAEAAHSALRRKARASQASVAPTAMDAKKAVRVAMSRAGEAVLDVAVGVRQIVIDPVMPDMLSEAQIENALLMRVEDKNGAHGLVMLCPQVVGAIIEASTLGTVFPIEAEIRPPTDTDAVLSRGFLDYFFKIFGILVEEIPHPPPVAGYVMDQVYVDLRTAQMALADAAHKRYTITLDFGLGAKVGHAVLVLPAQREAPPEQVADSDSWGDALEKAVMGTQAHLEARLGAVRLSLAEVTALKVGDVLPLKDSSVNSVSLIGPTGQRVSGARLGRAGPMRAVRVRLVEEEDGAPQHDMAAMGEMGGEMPALGAMPAPAAPLSLPPADDGFGDGDFGAAPLDGDMGAPLDGMAMDAAPLDLDIGGDAGGMLGAIEPIQVPADEANPG
jgi:flagellar motor switch protein FliM